MKKTSRKVVIVGTGFVGTSIAYAMINQGVANELVLIDVNQEKAEGEALDLLDGMAWGEKNVSVWSGTYEECQDANLVILTAGVNQKPGQTRLDLVKTNATITRQIVKEVMASGFDGIFVVASNPVDILTYLTWQESGLPASRVVGTGTTLDTTRFRKEIALKLAVDPRSVHGYILGEHGDSEVAAWSHTTVGGKPIMEYVEKDHRLEENDLTVLADKVKNAAYEIIDRKKATYYGIGMSTTRIVKAILNNEQAVLPVSAYLNGEYGEEDIFTGVPSIVDENGVREIIDLSITPQEKAMFHQSVSELKAVLDTVRLEHHHHHH
uniref:L-lactate dehydrogenase n=2 Tax=Enterococcus TaxID=1350 RepID=UPI0004F13D2E|nr:Chain A, L-lactate dehydrogenase [Enterococcus mundtii]3WSV_B Chain B, L-lactate dehydrogenase [Enterococcus mundtii]3WSV_C Chain C, L-lactate dehydrogenase [Enterococcus mundtii]3WSV_D Chain D, L-lactate dehydrogenase [Enterococcus mundtii]3WSW_A Chain A, L-lactate dehydrogenase [Enterococcus mundtii]3WSW_B Chain B, L-lactate dehydrogenase [Enterococcus mundtii]3WSW_C Chain C, L-lactate dehydrogenase [Enterococcus mundtii]3WSW_D Chain D, L-lactate dehydrogenase [Enterococcus mundtii]